MKTTSFEIIAGTYEEFLIGYRFSKKQSELVQSFATHNHSGSIRCVTVSGHYLATGASDDRIIVYDLKSRKEHCMLTHHEATINCLKFTHNHSHLVSGSADGVLAIVRVGNWQLEKIWEKAHKGYAILDIAIHSSGKLALTLGSDCSLRTWNLVKGRQAYIINLNSKSKDAKSLDKIVWADDGIRFTLFGGKYTEIWSIESGGILEVIEHDAKINSCIWLSDDEILVGYENGQIATVRISDGVKDIRNAHDGRVKALAKYNKWIVSCSSAGEIKVWSKNLKELAKQYSGCRITCLDIVPSIKIKNEEKEEVLEVVEEETTRHSVKKSTVVMEIEGSDNESIFNTNYKRDDINESIDLEALKPDKVKRKKKHTLQNVDKTERKQIKKKKIEETGRKKIKLKLESIDNHEHEKYLPNQDDILKKENTLKKSNRNSKNAKKRKVIS